MLFQIETEKQGALEISLKIKEFIYYRLIFLF